MITAVTLMPHFVCRGISGVSFDVIGKLWVKLIKERMKNLLAPRYNFKALTQSNLSLNKILFQNNFQRKTFKSANAFPEKVCWHGIKSDVFHL